LLAALIAIVPPARVGAQTITLGPGGNMLTSGGSYDVWDSNQVTEQGVYTPGGYAYSFTNTTSTSLFFTPQTFGWYSAQNYGNIADHGH